MLYLHVVAVAIFNNPTVAVIDVAAVANYAAVVIVAAVAVFSLLAVVYNEALPEGTCSPCSPKIKHLFSYVPRSPILSFVPLFPSKFGLCSPEINTLYPLFP